jgi:hypothetical protein
MLYSWGELGPGSFFLRLGGLWLAVFTVLGAPIAAASFNPSRVSAKLKVYAHNSRTFNLVRYKKSLCIQYTQEYMCSAHNNTNITFIMLLINFSSICVDVTLQEPLRFILAAGTGTLFIVSLIILRIYLVRSDHLLPVHIISLLGTGEHRVSKAERVQNKFVLM